MNLDPVLVKIRSLPNEPASFVQRLPNVFQTSCSVIVVQTSLVHCVGVRAIKTAILHVYVNQLSE